VAVLPRAFLRIVNLVPAALVHLYRRRAKLFSTAPVYLMWRKLKKIYTGSGAQ
jgi:hypothetical protein